MPKTVKTAISVDAGLYAKAETLRKKLKMTRSEFYARGVEAMLERAAVLMLEREYVRAYERAPDDDAAWAETGLKLLAKSSENDPW